MSTETTVKERPLIRNAAQVRAILRGATQFREVLKSQPYTLRTEGFGYPTKAGGFVSLKSEHCLNEAPHGKPGGQLWVKEAVVLHVSIPQVCGYAADGAKPTEHWEKAVPPSRMPQYASRITLEITDVRVQRLNDIGEKDALAEGIERIRPGVCDGGGAAMGPSAYIAFMRLWNSIYGDGAWSANPWIWAYTFRRVIA